MENTKISWTTHTFNPWIGCTKVSAGCTNCYAATQNMRYKRGANWGLGAPRSRTGEKYWNDPRKWNRVAAEEAAEFNGFMLLGADVSAPVRPKVFCASLADWLDGEVEIDWLADLLVLIHDTPFLDWQLLTKRPENWKSRLASAVNLALTYRPATAANNDVVQWVQRWLNGRAPANVWMGTSVEDQHAADKRVPLLLNIPARVRFLSVEPMLGYVDARYAAFNGADSFSAVEGIHWVICGGESGPRARPMDLEWARHLRDQCRAAGVPFFFKQLGGVSDKGGDLGAIPHDLRIREFPTTHETEVNPGRPA